MKTKKSILLIIVSIIALSACAQNNLQASTAGSPEFNNNPNYDLIDTTEMNYVSSNHDYTHNTDTQNNTNSTPTVSYPDGLIMHDGEMMLMINKSVTVMKNDTTLSDGTIILSNGAIGETDNSVILIEEGEYIEFSSIMTSLKKEVELNQTMLKMNP